MISMKRFLDYLFASKTETIRNRKPARAKPTLEALEDRTVPVIRESGFAIPVAAGGSWDGVVHLSGVNGTGTGTLLADGRHTLTAAHVVDSDGTSGMLGAMARSQSGSTWLAPTPDSTTPSSARPSPCPRAPSRFTPAGAASRTFPLGSQGS
jgi:hypothetical protein